MKVRETMSSIVTRRQFLMATLAAALTWKCVPSARSIRNVQPETAIGSPLHVLAERAGISIGAAVGPECLDEAPYAETLSREFNMVVPENHLKWEHVHPSEGSYNFSPADRIITFAESHGMKARGHALLWHQQVPQWLTSRDWSRTGLTQILEDHIGTVVGRYAGRIQYWDVANEVIERCLLGLFGCGLRETFWLRAIGEDYIARAFAFAREADPEAKLFINDYGAEEMNAKSNALYTLVRDMRESGVPVDGVGFQLHLRLSRGLDFNSFERNLQRFIDLGMEIHFTEVDVAISGEVNEEKLEQQAVIYHRLMTIARRYPQITAFLTWGVTDKYSWLPWFAREIMRSNEPYGSGLLFDEQYNPKPAYFGLLNALQTNVQ